MHKKSGTSKDAADKLVKGIKRKTRKHYSAEEKVRIVLAGLRRLQSFQNIILSKLFDASRSTTGQAAEILTSRVSICQIQG